VDDGDSGNAACDDVNDDYKEDIIKLLNENPGVLSFILSI